MRTYIAVFLAILTAVALVGCNPENTPTAMPTGEDAVVVIITDDGIISKTSEVVVLYFHRGARAEACYRIYNKSSGAIMPVIQPIMDANVLDYSKARGHVNAPVCVRDWIQIQTPTLIEPDNSSDFVVALLMPKDADKMPDKFAFQIGVSHEVKGGTVSRAGIWWMISMR